MREITFMIKYAPICLIIVMICTLVYLYSLKLTKHMPKSQVAYRLGAIEVHAIKEKKEYWRLITANFIHVDFLHYLFNIYFMISLGSWLEANIDRGLFIILLVVSGFTSAVLTYLYDLKKQHYHITFGASGFGFGMLGFIAGLMLFHHAIAASAIRSFTSMIVINLIYTFARPDISKTGHIGGFVGGLLVSLLW